MACFTFQWLNKSAREGIIHQMRHNVMCPHSVVHACDRRQNHRQEPFISCLVRSASRTHLGEVKPARSLYIVNLFAHLKGIHDWLLNVNGRSSIVESVRLSRSRTARAWNTRSANAFATLTCMTWMSSPF